MADNTIPATSEGAEHIQQPDTGQRLDVPPLFGDENMSEAQLRGEDSQQSVPPETPQPEAPQPKAEQAEAEAAKQEAKTQATEQVEAEKAVAEEEAKPEEGGAEKPPKGYVPLAALHQERKQRQTLQEESALLVNQNAELAARLQAAEQVIAALQQDGKEIPRASGEEFTELSEAEFNDLVQEDPARALQYLHNVEKYRERTKQINEIKAKEEAIIQQSYQVAMEQAPEVFSDPQYNAALIECAVDAGIPKPYLAALTNPNTRIVLADGVSEVVLGPAAAGITLLVNRYFKTQQGVKQQENTLRAKLTKEITNELIKKFKTEGSFKNLDTLPASSDEAENQHIMFSEESYARMTPEQRRAALGG